MLIEPTVDAAKYHLQINRLNRGGSLRLVGANPGTLAVKVATVVNPDPGNPDHWTPAEANGVAITVTQANNPRGIPFSCQLLLEKPASPGNEWGVEYDL